MKARVLSTFGALPKRLLSASFLLLSGSSIAAAATVTVDPELLVSETYTDNVALSPPGEEDDEFITQIAPGIAISRIAPRLRVLFNYQFEYLVYANDSDRNTSFHDAEALGELTAIPEWLYLRAGGSYTQQIIDTDAPIALDTLSVTDNRTDVSTTTLNPFLSHRFDDNLRLLAEYRLDEVDYKSDLPDSKRVRTLVRIGSDETASRRWHLLAVNREIDPEDAETTRLNRWEAAVGRRFSPKLAVDLRGGYEDNEYGGLGTVFEEDGRYWFVDGIWSPTSRMRIEASYGHRLFGNTGALTIVNRTAVGNFHLRYVEEFTAEVETLISSEIDTIDDEIGEEAFEEEEIDLGIPITAATDSDVYLDSRWSGRWEILTGRTELNIYGYRSLREYQQTGDEEELSGGGADWAWLMMPRTWLRARGEIQFHEYPGTPRSDDIWFLRAGLERQMTRRLAAGISYRYTERDSNAVSSDYSQNMLTVFARAEF